MKKQWNHYTAEEKVAILRQLCDELGLQPTVF